jgi:hypothetical protein
MTDKKLYKKEWVLITIILAIAALIVILFFKKIQQGFCQTNFSEFSSSYMAWAAILVTVLLVFNFAYVYQIIEISRKVKDDISEIPTLKLELEEAKKTINFYKEIAKGIPKLKKQVKLYKRQFNKLYSKQIEIEFIECLEGLKSGDIVKIRTSSEMLGERGKTVHLPALKKALDNAIKQNNTELIIIINSAIAKIKVRQKYNIKVY